MHHSYETLTQTRRWNLTFQSRVVSLSLRAHPNRPAGARPMESNVSSPTRALPTAGNAKEGATRTAARLRPCHRPHLLGAGAGLRAILKSGSLASRNGQRQMKPFIGLDSNRKRKDCGTCGAFLRQLDQPVNVFQVCCGRKEVFRCVRSVLFGHHNCHDGRTRLRKQCQA